jgi:hypothetical protein
MDAQQLASSVACSVFEKELNLRKAFSKYDVDGSDTLDRTEFQSVMAEVGADNPTSADAVFDLFDTDGNGIISSNEFTEALLDYGGQAAAPPPSNRHGGVPTPRTVHSGSGSLSSSLRMGTPQCTFGQGHGEAQNGFSPDGAQRSPRTGVRGLHATVGEAGLYEEVTGESMTDAEVMDELSDRLAAEGVPLHTLFRVLCPAGSGGGRQGGMMTEAGLRDVLCKMGLASTTFKVSG